ncbi:MAG: hypothetical protein IJ928_09310, partial [Prevotella sp.]|nr:hypothetical protein [Prevotella sp.]
FIVFFALLADFDAPQGVEDVPPLRSGDILHPLRGLLLPSILGREITLIGLHFYLESYLSEGFPCETDVFLRCGKACRGR